VAVAETIIMRRSDRLDPTTFRDRYQETLRELIEAKMNGVLVKPKQIAPPAPVHDFMAALKRGLARIIHEALEAAVLQRDRRAVFRGVGDAVVGV
jgi:non-homologous end joining protein Ku